MTHSNAAKPLISLIVPVFNNEPNLPETMPTYMDYLAKLEGVDYEMIFVEDGSRDKSWQLLQEFQAQHPEKVTAAKLTRNFGQRAAMFAGAELAKGDCIAVISADMQDPIDMIEKMLGAWREGHKLVIAARADRKDSGTGKIFSKLAHFFVHKFITKSFPKGGYDYFLLDRAVVDEWIRVNEKNGQPFILFTWFGYDSKVIEYVRQKRRKGKSGWSFSMRINLFLDIITTYTYIPLRAISLIGVLASIVGFIYGSFYFIYRLFNRVDPQAAGWTSIIILITFFSGLILVSLGIIGEYIWRIFDAANNRPSYVLDSVRRAKTR